MQLKRLAGLCFIIILCNTTFAQQDGHKWKTLTTTPQLLWVDAAQLDSIQSDQFEIWIVELHKPALNIDGINAKVNRTKTLYIVNRKINRYGVKRVVYYNNANKEIWQYDYGTDSMSDEMRFNFPIANNSFLIKVFESLDKKRQKNNDQS